MQKLAISLLPLAFATAAVQAQDTGAQPVDPNAPETTAPDTALPDEPAQDAAPAAPSAVPPAADAGVQPSTSAPADATAAAASPPAAATTVAVTDAEVQSYAKAAVKVQTINADAALDDTAKQQQMVAAVSESGLAPERFNEISSAIESDTTLRAKVQTAMAAHAAAHQG